MPARCDVAVVGRGPAGSAAAAFLRGRDSPSRGSSASGVPGSTSASRSCPRACPAGTAFFFEFIERYYDPAFLDVFFAPRPPATLMDALTRVFAGGAFLEQPLWLRARLECVRLAVRRARWLRRRRGQPVDSQLSW